MASTDIQSPVVSASAGANEALIERIGQAHFEPGYWQGLRQPVALVRLRLTRQAIQATALQQFDAVLATVQAHAASPSLAAFIRPATLQHPVLGRLCRMALGVLQTMGMPIVGGAAAVRTGPHATGHWTLALPAIAQNVQAPQVALALACRLMNELDAGRSVVAATLAAEIRRLTDGYRPLAPHGVNTLRLLQAAHELGIPWRHIANNVYQFGWGSRSRWLDSSFTDETSIVSASLARDKVACARVLRHAGLPVPSHQLVTTAEKAVRAADALGYPVVLKPANLDGGVGVMVGLRDAQSVARAFDAIARISKRILVEQFMAGNDYRVRVCKGKAIGVVIRKPAGVTGDGVQSVRQLIESVNRQRATSHGTMDPAVEHGSKPIVVDDEVLQWLASQQLGLDSVIPAGHQVRLRGAANVSLGGTTWEVTQDVHPDNLALALEAVAVLRLDVAGVDLLLPDVSRSWKETGGAVCEVNGQPQFSHAIAIVKVLQSLLANQGRIPVVLIQGLSSESSLGTALTAELLGKGHRIGWHQEVSDCLRALSDRRVDALVWAPRQPLAAFAALPVDRADLVIRIQGSEPGWSRTREGSVEQWSCPDSANDIQALKEALFEWLNSSLQAPAPAVPENGLRRAVTP